MDVLTQPELYALSLSNLCCWLDKDSIPFKDRNLWNNYNQSFKNDEFVLYSINKFQLNNAPSLLGNKCWTMQNLWPPCGFTLSGIFWPAMGVLRSKYLPESSKYCLSFCLDFAQWINLSPGTRSTVIVSFLRFQVVPQSWIYFAFLWILLLFFSWFRFVTASFSSLFVPLPEKERSNSVDIQYDLNKQPCTPVVTAATFSWP